MHYIRHSGVTCSFTTGVAPPTQAIYQDSPETSEVGAVGRRTKEKVGWKHPGPHMDLQHQIDLRFQMYE